MKFICLPLSYHDDSICYYDDNHKHNIKYIKFERKTQIKHDAFIDYFEKGKKYPLKELLNIIKEYSGDENIDYIFCSKISIKNILINEDYVKFLSLFEDKIISIQEPYPHHHDLHKLSCDFFAKSDWTFTIDGRGSLDISWCVYKKDELIEQGFTKQEGSIGWGIEYLANMLNIKGHIIDQPGKLMALQTYGKIDKEFYKIISKFDMQNIGITRKYDSLKKERVFHTKQNTLFDYDLYLKHKQTPPTPRDILDYTHTIHFACGEVILNLFKKYANHNDTINYSGGCAQNIIWNTKLKNNFPNLQILPHCGDEGISIGVAEYARTYLNLPPLHIPNYPFGQSDQAPKETVSSVTIKLVAQELAKNKIVAWYQGSGEIGPRALGNRSILMDPRIQNGKDIINSIKNREAYRPFGASVLSEFKKEYFDLDFENPYMLYVGNTQKDNLESITHVDGTCRVQTVSKEGPFRELLKEFHKITECPVLLNTSLNISGKPISGYLNNAIEEFKNTNIDILVVGNEIYRRDL